jgi:hypothetical protein
MKRKLLVMLGLLVAPLALVGPAPASAVSNTPVWIGAPCAGRYLSGTRPGTHGGNQVAFDYYCPAGSLVRIYAAPKNNALNNQVTAHIVGSGPGSNNAANCGYYAIVEIRHNNNAIGRVTFSHLAGRATARQISRWNGIVGRVASLPFNQPSGSCYRVTNPGGQHTHIEFRNYGGRPACAHDYGAVGLSPTNYQGYLGDYGKAPIARNGYVCPNGI